MNVKKFIDRPILSGIISAIILFMGAIGLCLMPVEQFPEIAPPEVSVTAYYSGASASTVQKSVIVPLEEVINGVENMIYMTSNASNGSAEITVYFKQGTDPDMATINVQNKVSEALSLLPADVTSSGVSVAKRQSSVLRMFTLNSPDNRYDNDFIVNYIEINIKPRIARISGVGEVDVFGAEYAMRVWLDPQKMAQYGLMPSDINAVLDEQNIESSTGVLGEDSESTFNYNLLYKGRLESDEDFKNMVIKSLSNGEVLRLRDVAKVELGSLSYGVIGEINGHNGRMCRVSQTSGSNANEISIQMDEVMEEIRSELPAGLVLEDVMNTKTFLDASIKNVVITLIQAILLVILVVYIFLQSFKSTIIPAISIIVSLIGTFAFIYAIGFSINLLTLFALVLVIGTVVDDAIVVVEAVQTKFDNGYKSAYLASVDAMKEVSSALVTTTIVFMAVFIPVSFVSGTTGTFYTQFGITMAIAVVISTLNALTLSPALCALIVTPHADMSSGEKASFSTRFHYAFETAFSRLIGKYIKCVLYFMKRRWVVVALIVVACGGLYYMLYNTKTALVPNEDMGSFYIYVQTSPGYGLKATHEIMQEVEERIKTIDEIERYALNSGRSILGSGGPDGGMFVVRLKDWSERTEDSQSIDAVIARVYQLTSDITNANIMAFASPMIMGYGMSTGLEIHVQDRKGGSIEELEMHTQNFIQALMERDEIVQAQTSFNTHYPQYIVSVDPALCKRNGVSSQDVLSTLAGYVGGNYASNINKFSKMYRVMMQAPADVRIDLNDLENMYVRNDNGEMSPITQYMTLEKTMGTQSLSRYNLFSSIPVNTATAEGYSSGQAIEAVREVAAQTLPTGYSFEFGGMSREESSSSTTIVIIFIICVVFVYFILCGLYESLLIPFVVMSSIPFGLLGSFIFANMFGLSNDIYMQTGLIMLIGLLAKTAILLTEYASEGRKQGLTIMQAALTAAKVRLRPILMTSLTLIFGMIPLVFATGVGANGNISLGVGVVGGMLLGTIALLFIVPVMFVVFQNIEERVMPKRVLPKIEE